LNIASTDSEYSVCFVFMQLFLPHISIISSTYLTSLDSSKFLEISWFPEANYVCLANNKARFLQRLPKHVCNSISCSCYFEHSPTHRINRETYYTVHFSTWTSTYSLQTGRDLSQPKTQHLSPSPTYLNFVLTGTSSLLQ
jgi:hypothetical protein